MDDTSLLLNVLVHLDKRDLIAYKTISKKYQQLIESTYFWKYKYEVYDLEDCFNEQANTKYFDSRDTKNMYLLFELCLEKHEYKKLKQWSINSNNYNDDLTLYVNNASNRTITENISELTKLRKKYAGTVSKERIQQLNYLENYLNYNNDLIQLITNPNMNTVDKVNELTKLKHKYNGLIDEENIQQIDIYINMIK